MADIYWRATDGNGDDDGSTWAKAKRIPKQDLIERLRDCYEGCPFPVTTAPVALLIDAEARIRIQQDALVTAHRIIAECVRREQRRRDGLR